MQVCENTNLSSIPRPTGSSGSTVVAMFLNGNHITQADLGFLPAQNILRLLDLSNNKIHALPASGFKRASQLTSLDLSGNALVRDTPGRRPCSALH